MAEIAELAETVEFSFIILHTPKHCISPNYRILINTYVERVFSSPQLKRALVLSTKFFSSDQHLLTMCSRLHLGRFLNQHRY